MKGISEKFTDEEHAQLLEAKGNMSWHDFIMTLVEKENAEEE